MELMFKFPMGGLHITPGAFAALEKAHMLFVELVVRHLMGDWGDMCDEDKMLNDEAVKHGGRIFSAYETEVGKLWIITEADRSATTILLPSEY